MEKMQTAKRLFLRLAIAYWLFALLIFAVSHEQFRYENIITETLTPVSVVGELTDGMVLEQSFVVPTQRLLYLNLLAGTYARENDGRVMLSLLDEEGQIMQTTTVPADYFADGQYTAVTWDADFAECRGTRITLRIETIGCAPGNAITFYFGSSLSGGRVELAQRIPTEDHFKLNGAVGAGKLCMSVVGNNDIGFYKLYWLIISGAFLAAVLFFVKSYRRAAQGRGGVVFGIMELRDRYSFLLKQLVMRDFKTKYKRSVLGVAWSLLSPLMSMAVQYIVFSTLFKSDTPNYPVYLLTGIVFFNFFNEAVSLGLCSITNNAPLIKKVYMPRYVYPVSRVLSSLVNFGFALIPLLLVMLLTGTRLTPALLLLSFDILCLAAFVMGVVLLLSTAMTFFQDTQFIWGILSMMWMYATPVFYTENIIPQHLRTLFHMNPMYQYITFARNVILMGSSPVPISYLFCIASAAVVLALGIVVFRKHQDDFILYL